MLSKPLVDTSSDIPIGPGGSGGKSAGLQPPFPQTTPTSLAGQQALHQPATSITATILTPGDNIDTSSPLNSLELLQQKAQGILNNASHGLLKNSLADLSYARPVTKDDPHFKHRCKFCGKVFGSDSALQIPPSLPSKPKPQRPRVDQRELEETRRRLEDLKLDRDIVPPKPEHHGHVGQMEVDQPEHQLGPEHQPEHQGMEVEIIQTDLSEFQFHGEISKRGCERKSKKSHLSSRVGL